MSSHADTIRVVLDWPMTYYNEEHEQLARKALDALLAENQRLRDALVMMRTLAGVSTEGDPWYAEQEGLDADAIFKSAREALAGDAE